MDRKGLLKENWPVLVVSIVLALFLWALPLQTQDGPNHKKVATILERLSHSPVENSVYKSQLSPFHTNQLFPLLYLPASHFLSIDTYEKIFVGFFIFLLILSYRYFLSVWSPQNSSLWILVLPFLFHPLFVMGMYNYLASIPLTLIALSLMHKGFSTRKWIYFPLFSICSWLAFLAHPFPFFILPICLILLAFEFRRNIRVAALYSIPIVLFLALGFALPLVKSNLPGLNSSYYSFKSLPELLAGLFVYNVVGYSIPQLILPLLFFLTFLGLMIYSFVFCPWRKKIYWVTFLILYLLFPNEGNGGTLLNQRFLPFVCFFLPLGMRLSSAAMRRIQGLVMLTTLIMAGGIYWGMNKVNRIVQGTRKVLQTLPTESRLYPINFDPRGPGLTYSSLMHLWAVYENKKIVFSPYLFAHVDLMPLFRILPSSPTYFPATRENLPEMIAQNEICRSEDIRETVSCEALKEKSYQSIIQSASYYDYWFIHSPPPSFLHFIESIPGLKKIAEQNDSTLWHFENSKEFDPLLSKS